MPAAKFEITRQCKVCGETFVAKTIESWYCSPKCSKIAWKRRKDEELRLQRLDDVVKKIPKSKEYITVPEAYALFGISKETLYRLIRKGTIPSVNAGERQTLLSKEELMKLYPLGNNYRIRLIYTNEIVQLFLTFFILANNTCNIVRRLFT